MTFLGMLLNGKTLMLSIPLEKRNEALQMVRKFKHKNKATIKELQTLAGHLNFINRAVVPGRVFTRCMYSKFTGSKFASLKQYHHIRIDKEFRRDCKMWELFLTNLDAVVCPFIDLKEYVVAENLNFFMDASANESLGFGGIFENSWFFGKWEPNFIKNYNPNIEFLELLVLCMGVYIWSERIQNTHVILHCDNEAVIQMVNNMTSSCEHCMKLLRLLTLNNLEFNRRVFIRHVAGKNNCLSDSLSQLQFDRFFHLAPKTIDPHPEKLSVCFCLSLKSGTRLRFLNCSNSNLYILLLEGRRYTRSPKSTHSESSSISTAYLKNVVEKLKCE